MKVLASLFSLTLAAAAAGCAGGLADDRYPGTPLASITGSLNSTPGLALAQDVSLAIFWLDGLQGHATVVQELAAPADACAASAQTRVVRTTAPGVTSQAVTYTAPLPSTFTLPIQALPPAGALVDLTPLGGSGHLSMGMVVAYRDTNANGRFDFGSPGVSSEPIVATSWGSAKSGLVIFLDGTLPASNSELFIVPPNSPQGFSVATITQGAAGPTVQGFPSSQPIGLDVGPVVLAPGLDVATVLGCATRQTVSKWGGPMPAGATGACQSADRFDWSRRSSASCVVEEHFGATCLEPGDPRPAGWSCP